MSDDAKMSDADTVESESALEMMLTRPSRFGAETGKSPLGEFYPGQETVDFIAHESVVLCIGAGGLGCELLKDLALSGFKQIHVIDMDTIDVTNLNRQFLFRAKDVGRSKATVAAEFVEARVPGVSVTPHTCRIQEKDEDFYRQFTVVIGGLDNIEARRWMNAMLHDIVETDDDDVVDPATVIPFIDGGTQAFQGQARVIIPTLTSCFECSLDMFPPQIHFPLCTVAETPRKPEHCIAWAMFAVNQTLANPESQTVRQAWVKEFNEGTKLNNDDASHMRFLHRHAEERAGKFAIEGVTYMLTMGVVKNIIPAVASTNAVIAAACTNEAWKAQSFASQNLQTYFQYNGNDGLYTSTYELGKKDQCPVCSPETRKVTVPASSTLQQFIDMLVASPEFNCEAPSIAKPGMKLFMQKPPALRKATEGNLAKRMDELVDGVDDVLSVTDSTLPTNVSLEVSVRFEG